MGAKVSPEMEKARKLIEAGGGKVTAYAAAQATGLTTGAISRSAWYKKRVAAWAAQAETAPADPLERARVLVVDEGYTAYAAAKRVGIAQSTISRAPWYREYMAANETNFKRQPGGNKK